MDDDVVPVTGGCWAEVVEDGFYGVVVHVLLGGCPGMQGPFDASETLLLQMDRCPTTSGDGDGVHAVWWVWGGEHHVRGMIRITPLGHS